MLKSKQPVHAQQQLTAAMPTASTSKGKEQEAPAFKFRLPIDDATAPQCILDYLLSLPITLSAKDIIALSLAVQKELRQLVTTKHVESVTSNEVFADEPPDDILSDALPDPESVEVFMATTKPIKSLRVIDATFGTDTTRECVVNNGSELIVIRKDKWQKTGSDYILSRNILMETTNSSASWTLGITKNLKMTIQGLSEYVQAQIIEDTPYEVLLGCPFFSAFASITKDYTNGDQDIMITCPTTGVKALLNTHACTKHHACEAHMAATGTPDLVHTNAPQYVHTAPLKIDENSSFIYETINNSISPPIFVSPPPPNAASPPKQSTAPNIFTVGKGDNPYHLTEDDFTDMLTAPRMAGDLVLPYNRHISTVALEINLASADSFAYKKVANRIKPVATTLPEKFCIVRHIPSDPLADLPMLPKKLPDFVPGTRYMEERMKAQNINLTGFLMTEEEKLIHHLICIHEGGFAWSKEEKGRFSDNYFDPVVILTIKHVPWVLKNIPILPGKYNEIIKIIKDKIASGIYEPSNSSY
ncbi:hypothetical protein AX14_005891 [Amanita brunnescens Koide BX004]|nr:hypothetical protein AX14_005891 [Amanita brunnescens Koide BX004]